ncbi:MAG: hypothetical protein HP028_04860 [Clostridia bacterium]|jgi:hypothetical protein|nr:hypothetical protein [Clostridia bacterium]
MENDGKISNGNTFKLGISFDIDVPKNFNESVFNSIILGLVEYKNLEKEEWNTDLELKIKIKNDLIMRIQSELEQLITKVEE